MKSTQNSIEEIEFDTNLEAWQQMIADEKLLLETFDNFVSKYSSFILDAKIEKPSNHLELFLKYDGKLQRQFLQRIQSEIEVLKDIS
jgi:hypothetical protein